MDDALIALDESKNEEKMVESKSEENNDTLEESKMTSEEEINESKQPDLPSELSDPKVIEFLRILDEYRLKCEDEGNYPEAERASKQLDNLRNQEMKRQVKALKARQISERQDIQIAHNLQFTEFNAAWEKYMEEYDDMAQKYIKQMTERHAHDLRLYQEKAHQKVLERPPKFSKELIEWRRRQHMLAKTKNYAEANKIKRIADMMEAKERSKIDTDWQTSFAAKENKFRAQQQAELEALLKRIDVRRKEHLSQRALDSKRLLQRNRNVQAVLGSKQAVEERLTKTEIKNRLNRPRHGTFGASASKSSAIVVPKKSSKPSEQRKSKGNTLIHSDLPSTANSTFLTAEP